MRMIGLCLLLAVVARVAVAVPDEKVMSEALQLRERGEFDKATRLLSDYIEQASATLEHSDLRTVQFEIERMRRIRADYKLTRDKALEGIRRRIPDFTEEEFDRYEREGRFDVMLIDGQKFYMNSTPANLLKRDTALRARQPGRQPDGTYRKLYAHMLRVKEAARRSRDSHVLPQDFAVTYTLTVKPGSVPAGKTVRCWLPYVRAFPFQTEAHVLATDPPEHLIAPPEADHRTIYLEKTAEDNKPVRFMVSYVYRCRARTFDLDPARVEPYRKDEPLYKHYTASRKPHLDLDNPLLHELNKEIVGSETNPLVVARRIHDWMTRNMIYQFAREYSTLDNISHYTASRRAGDCGQHAMFFIAMCRLNGIPARWQSGWECFEARGNNMHDWSEIYVEPWGWIPVDTDMSLNTLRDSAGDLDTTQAQELADWLFGNMDHYRLATNADWGAPLYPPKNDFRSETVDFQRGEVEYDDVNLYFDKWSWNMEIEPLTPQQAAALVERFVPPPVEFPAPPEPPAASAPPDADTASTTTAGAPSAVPAEGAPTTTATQDAASPTTASL